MKAPLSGTRAGSSPVPAWLPSEAGEWSGVGRLIDYSVLRAEATGGDVERLCEEAVALGLAAVCVNGGWVPLAVRRVRGSAVRVAAVVGFPLGAMAPAAKAAEARLALGDGAGELDMMMALGLAKAGEWVAVEEDIAAVVSLARGIPVKVILETAALTPEEIGQACRSSQVAGARYVKTSTGFHPAGGATPEAVRLLRAAVGVGMGVKASGGIRTCGDVLTMIQAGADRIGTSSLTQLGDCLGPKAPPFRELLRTAGSLSQR